MPSPLGRNFTGEKPKEKRGAARQAAGWRDKKRRGLTLKMAHFPERALSVRGQLISPSRTLGCMGLTPRRQTLQIKRTRATWGESKGERH